MKKVIVTTSWDDGHIFDIKLSNLLKKYRIQGTFYISPKDREFSPDYLLKDIQIKDLSSDFEIGAHTMTHCDLVNTNIEEAKREIIDSKLYLQKITGKEIRSFCYPRGYYNDEHKKILKENDFILARTVNRLKTDLGSDRFSIPTTIHAYRHWSDAYKIFRVVGLRKFIKAYLNWDELAIILFDKTLKEGGVFHVWGHSWEIEKNRDWPRLERVLEYISKNKNITYVTNSELVCI